MPNRNCFNFLCCLQSRIGLFLLIGTFSVFLSCSGSKEDHSDVELGDWQLGPFVKVDSLNPILLPGDLTFECPVLGQNVSWEEKDVFNPAAVVMHGQVNLLFRAEDLIGSNNGTSRIGLATSSDGMRFEKLPEPVFYPENDSLKHLEWDGGVEDPRVVKGPDGHYVMTYTSYDGQTARLMLALSKDLKKWDKYGRVLTGEFSDTWSKSGAIVARQAGEEIIAEKINGYYWMYFGDTDLFLARSTNLIDWEPLVENGGLKSVLKPRPGYFDSRLVEPGPFALVREAGILMLYNGMNLDEGGDPSLAPGTYSAGQVLFDLEDPSVVLARSEEYFLTPEKDYEIEGQINRVCFIEGLVPFQGRWFLYYGTADSKIAVAVAEDSGR
ncbi:MAG: glycosidase [Lunatimonas sp.]|uniref:glycoside hydrolase family 130 protein n=1 Tax=Lunatimonas sp. TaxID=2060141 RepID=UPI00263B9DEB|nr:glycoside hydrolase family 130 protein [Lunatimonas sp.]MCC5938815.1 glycosidase [Lunatimonas sp.]